MKNIAEKLLPMRFAVPLLIVLVLLYALISEINYRNTKQTLTGGIALTDARIGAAKLLQLLTDAETAQRGFLLTGDASYIQPLHHAQAELKGSDQLLQYIASIGPAGPADAQRIGALVAGKFADLDRTIELAQAGDREQALALVHNSGRQRMDELRALFQSKLAEAAQLQQSARDSIYAALRFSQIAVLVLSVLLMGGLLLYLRQLGARERQRADYQKKLEQEVNDKTRGLQTMASWLETVREDEKASLARELHDELGSLLTSAKLSLARMRPKLAHDVQLLERADAVNQRLNEGIALKRRIIENLRPSALQNLGLKAALEILTREIASAAAIDIEAHIDEVTLSPEANLSLYRLVQEALTNVSKYAAATRVVVQLARDGDGLRVKVEDNGKGFDTRLLRPETHGLTGMRFRIESHGGKLEVKSTPGSGTTISAWLPLEEAHRAPGDAAV